MSLSIGSPPYQPGTAREKHPHWLNETPSKMDPVFSSFTNLCMESSSQLVPHYTPLIEEHIERRVMFFFLQLIACYKTPFHFVSASAQSQAESPTKLYWKNKEGVRLSTQRNAAHSATLPLLVAYERAKWEAHLDAKGPLPQGFAFLQSSQLDKVLNATLAMPRFVNNADIWIDGTGNDGKLRVKALRIVNSCAKGIDTPASGLEKFLPILKEQILQAIERSEEEKPERQVLEIYLKKLAKIERVYQSHPHQVLNDLLGLHLQQNVRASLRQQSYQIRYQAIQRAQVEHTRILQKILQVQKSILRNNERKPSYFDAVFKTLLIESVGKEKQKDLKKLLSFSPTDCFQSLSEEQQTRFLRTKESLAPKQKEKIQEVAKEALIEMQRLREQELQNRGQIVKRLRLAQGWTQKELHAKTQRLFPTTSLNPTKVSEIENGKIPVPPSLAQELSRTFEVDPGLLLPQFFYD